MSIRDVLVHVGDDSHFEDRLDTAVAVAEKFDAHLIGLYARVAPYLPAHIKPYFTSEMLQEHADRAKRVEAEAKVRFEDRIRRTAVRSEWRHTSGNGARSLSSQGRYADIVIVGQHDPDDPGSLTTLNATVVSTSPT